MDHKDFFCATLACFSLFSCLTHIDIQVYFFIVEKKTYSLVITIIIGAVFRKYFKDAITFTKIFISNWVCVWASLLSSSIMLWWVFQPMNDFYGCVSIHSHRHAISIINWENILSWRTHARNILAVNFLFSLSLAFPFTYK